MEIHDDAHRLELALNLVGTKKGVHDADRGLILKFIDDLTAEGLKNLRLAKYAYAMTVLSEMSKKPFEKSKKEDVVELVRKIEQSKKAAWTKHDYKVALKRFFRWLRKTEPGSYPAEVSWIKTGFKEHDRILPTELLTVDDVTNLANAASNPRDKALIQVLYESGCRIGEILSLSLKQTAMDEYGCVLIVKGKTGMRRVRIIASTPSLTQWLENHPDKNNPDAPLWVGLWTKNLGQALDYNAVRLQMKKIALKAGLKKKIHPHLFRHSRASSLANEITEAQMKEHFGWTQGSEMAATYVHLSGRDVDRALLKASGIDVGEDEEKEKFQVKVCQRCREKNSPGQIFCGRCGTPLTMKTVIEMQKMDESEKPENAKIKRTILEQGEALAQLLKDPEVQQMMIRKIVEQGLEIGQND